MLPSAIELASVLLLVLPGFLAYKFAVARRAHPETRSPLWQLSEILEHSLYVHLIGVGLSLGVVLILRCFGIATHFSQLVILGPREFLGMYFIEGVLLLTLYPVYVIFAATIVGAYQLPTLVSQSIERSATGLITQLSRIPLLRWMPIPKPTYPEEPIWYHVFQEFTEGYSRFQPRLLVKMKLGDIYLGEISSYPVVPDIENTKDFLLLRTWYYPGGDLSQEYRLEEIDGFGAVLLNTENVDSIQIYYEPLDRLDDTPV